MRNSNNCHDANGAARGECDCSSGSGSGSDDLIFSTGGNNLTHISNG